MDWCFVISIISMVLAAALFAALISCREAMDRCIDYAHVLEIYLGQDSEMMTMLGPPSAYRTPTDIAFRIAEIEKERKK